MNTDEEVITTIKFNIDDITLEQLRDISKHSNCNMSTSIINSIKLFKLLMDVDRKHNKILIKSPNGKYEQLIFNRA